MFFNKPIVRSKENPFIIEWVSDGLAVPDDAAVETVLNAYNNVMYMQDCYRFTVGTVCLFNAARVLVKRGIIPFENIQFVFNGEIIPHNKGGKLNYWTTYDDLLDELISFR